MLNIGLVGYFGFATDNPIIGGQMAKTLGIYKELCRSYGKENVRIVDTSNWKKESVKLAFSCFQVAVNCDKIIIMPNKNGIKFVLPFFAAMKSVFKYDLAYPVVGGWLTDLLKAHSYLAKSIQKVDYILPETQELKKELTKCYAGKCDVMPIFSTRTPVSEAELDEDPSAPFSFCTFSRVTPEKGIDDAIRAIVKTNVEYGETRCVLDIWGPIEEGFEEHYKQLICEHEDCIAYKGILKGDDCLKTLSHYYMMLFPTYYPGEGFPTSVCESFMAGLPVIASDWRFNSEIITPGKTGSLYKARQVEELVSCIRQAIDDPRKIVEMKKQCLLYSTRFEPSKVMESLYSWLNESA